MAIDPHMGSGHWPVCYLPKIIFDINHFHEVVLTQYSKIKSVTTLNTYPKKFEKTKWA